MRFSIISSTLVFTIFNISNCRTFVLGNYLINFAHGNESSFQRIHRQIFGPPRNIYQHQLPDNSKFPCDLRYGARSQRIPNSVHMLTPGDIDVIGALGDSLTAAVGAFTTNNFELINEGRGASFSAGGSGTWNYFLTLPNILKLYNPKLYGYSLNERSSSAVKLTRFNVAENGAENPDAVKQAKVLVNRMLNDKNININLHWKLISYLFGGNDFCMKICRTDNPNKIIERSKIDLLNTLRILKSHLPRTLVNIILPPNVNILTKIRNSPLQCQIIHLVLCPCMFNSNYMNVKNQTLNIIELWKQSMEEIVKLPEFHDSPTFEVNIHRFLDKGDIPRFPNGDTDLNYLSKDCFHWSQKGHAYIANALWNSLLTPENQRLRYTEPDIRKFKCPTKYSPYLPTIKNS